MPRAEIADLMIMKIERRSCLAGWLSALLGMGDGRLRPSALRGGRDAGLVPVKVGADVGMT